MCQTRTALILSTCTIIVLGYTNSKANTEYTVSTQKEKYGGLQRYTEYKLKVANYSLNDPKEVQFNSLLWPIFDNLSSMTSIHSWYK